VVADPAHQRVPQAALCGMRADGSLDAIAVLRALWRRPGDIAGMPSVTRNAWVARAALARARQSLGRGFGLPDLG
jgi:adenosylhomocysteine nucleosidase